MKQRCRLKKERKISMELDQIRKEIDAIDTQMKDLYLKRLELSGQVAETKKATGGSVYVPAREKQVIQERSVGVDADKLPEYQTFLKEVMGISRTYQYAILSETAQELEKLPKGEGQLILNISCGSGDYRLATVLDAITLAGIMIEEVTATSGMGERDVCRMHLSGDFSTPLAKGAILQVLRELDHAKIVLGVEQND